MPSRTLATRRVATLCTTALLTAGLATGLTACGSDTTSTSAPPATASATSSPASSALVLDDGWVKAVDTGAMTGLFGTLRNPSDRDITVTGAASPVAAAVELHETVRNDSGAMRMQPVRGGFTVPAGGTRVLQPGGDHVMLMGLTSPLASGTTTTVTLVTSTGDVLLSVPVRAFPGAEESYVPTPSHS